MKRTVGLVTLLLAGLMGCGTVPLPEGTPDCGPDVEALRPSYSVSYRMPAIEEGTECMYCRHIGQDDEVRGCALPDGSLCAGQAEFTPAGCWVPQ